MSTKKTNYDANELAALIAETRSEFQKLIKSENVIDNGANGGEMVSKADGPPEEDKSASPESSGSPSDGGSADASAGGPPPSDDGSAGGPPPDAGSASADPSMGGGDPAAQGQVTPEQLQQAYAQLSPQELEMHMQAIQAVVAAQQGAGAGAPPPGPDAVAPAPGEGSKPIDPGHQMALKSEKDALAKLAKAESELANARKEIEGLKKNVDTVAEAVTLFLKKPERKAMTGKDYMAKSEPVEVDLTKLSKSEVIKKLNVIARDESLTKSERETINNYCKGTVKVEDLAPLFNRKK